MLAADLPEDPQWQDDQLREYLAEAMPGERRISWVAEETAGDGRLLGHVEHPAARRHRRARGAGPPGRAGGTALGRQLLAAAARRAYDEGFSSLGVEVVGDTPAVAFYESLGFQCEYVETRSVLQPVHAWTGWRWARWPAASAPATGSSTTRAGRRRS